MLAGAGGLKLARHSRDLRCDLQNDWTALMFAAKNGHYAVVKMLLERGAAVNHANTVGVFEMRNEFAIELSLHS